MSGCENPLRIAYIGNFEPEYSTENEYRDAFQRLGHRVSGFQEDRIGISALIGALRADTPIDFVLWTRTKGLADEIGNEKQWEMLRTADRAGVGVVGVHLDIWLGLSRATQIETDPYFRGVDLLFTADGGHQEEWGRYGVNHRWLLPAISERWLGVGTPRDEFRSKVAFVGSWQGQYHREAKHRHELINWLDKTYGDDVKFWPKRGQHAIRGLELNDLYASVDVVVGDSYLSPAGFYCSDRIPESLGRGATLLHPVVDGVTDAFEHYWWTAGDWASLRSEIERLTSRSADEIAKRREDDVNHIALHHTYTTRAATILAVLRREGMLA